MTTVIITIIVLGMLILLHELGHFLAARRAGILCREFAIGFGPAIYTWQDDETEFSLRLIPLGGYVLMAGEMPVDEEEDEEESPFRPAAPGRNFDDKTVLTRMGVIFAGPITNLVTAVLVFFFVYAVVGIPMPSLQVGQLEPGYPAEEAGFAVGDEVEMIDGEPVETWDELVDKVQVSPGRPMIFTVRRNRHTEQIEVVPGQHPDYEQQGYIGLAPQVRAVREPAWAAVAQSIRWVGHVIVLMGVTLWEMITGTTGTDQLIGVVGMGAEIGRAAEQGLASVLSLTGSISAIVGFMNLLPIPALDGSKLIFLAIEGVRGRPVDPEKEGLINMIGFALLIMLAVYVTFQDIIRLTG